MPRSLTEAPVTTKNARARLGSGVHWRAIDPEIHLGFRKAARGGRWIVRGYRGKGSYFQATIGVADDAVEADGVNVFNFTQASAKARLLVSESRAAAIASTSGQPITVSSLIEEHLQTQEAREAEAWGKAKRRDARSRLNRHVLQDEALREQQAINLSEELLSVWRDRLGSSLAPATVKRIVGDFKAALNAGARRHRSKLPAGFSDIIRNGLAAPEAESSVARDAQILSDTELQRLIASAWTVDREGRWEGDLARLIITLAATGARFSQAIRLKVGDVQPANFRVLIPVSRKGRGRKRAERIAIKLDPAVLWELEPAFRGRARGELLLLRPRWRQTSPTVWVQVSRDGWQSASELTRPWAKIVAAAGLQGGTIPYSLRHTSIVRGLKAGLPVRLVAALHDTSSAMIERHYAAFIVDAMDELSAKAAFRMSEATKADGTD